MDQIKSDPNTSSVAAGEASANAAGASAKSKKKNKKPNSAAAAVDQKPDASQTAGNTAAAATAVGEASANPTASAAKNKKKPKASAEKKAAEESASVAPASKPAKGRSALIKKIKQQQDQHDKEEEERKRAEEEEQRKAEEALRLKREQERREEERRRRRKEKDKERKERQKKEGTYRTATQKQKDRENLERLGLSNATAHENGAQEDATTTTTTTTTTTEKSEARLPQKKKVVYNDRKKTVKKEAKKDDENTTAKAEETDEKTIKKEKGEDSDDVERNEDEEEVLSSWDDSDGEDDKEEEEEQSEEEDEVDEDKCEEEDGDENEKETSAAASSAVSEASQEESGGDQQDQISSMIIAAAKKRIREHHERCEAERSETRLRCGVVCVMGHVDTGKTSLLDKLRCSRVQEGEVGGITQQIGATNVPLDKIQEETRMVHLADLEREIEPGSTKQNEENNEKKDDDKRDDKTTAASQIKLPGLLIIDTPGHESFTNMRSRGSSLCDIAILVVDLMHGIEDQTRESIRLLQENRTPFVVALNKIDRLYKWESDRQADICDLIARQQAATQNDFRDRFQKVVRDFAMLNLNVALYWENPDPLEYVSLVPTSAISGDGMGNLMHHLCMQLQAPRRIRRIAFSNELQAVVMEVKEVTGHGTTLDVIVINGHLQEGQAFTVAGVEGPITTHIKSILVPAPNKDTQMKNVFSTCKRITGAVGVKITGRDGLEKALAGLPMYVSEDSAEQQVHRAELFNALPKLLRGIQTNDVGVYVQASTIGSLEALLEYLRSQNIPFSGINIGPIHQHDVKKAAVMVDRDPKWAVILGFNVKIEAPVARMAQDLGVRVFRREIIYHLHDDITQYLQQIKEDTKERFQNSVIYPVALRILPEHIYGKRNPLIMGVRVEAGQLRVGTPICCVNDRGLVRLGTVTRLEKENRPVTQAKTDDEVSCRIDTAQGERHCEYKRHFDENDSLVSHISRESIDVLKEHFREELTQADWKLVIKLKKVLQIT